MKLLKTQNIYLSLIFIFLILPATRLKASAPARDFYQLIIYHIADKVQEQRLDQFLSQAYVPELHRAGIKSVGVYKTQGIDTASQKRIYVLIPFSSLEQFHASARLFGSEGIENKGSDYWNTPHDKPAYIRKESILMEAFAGMAQLEKPKLSGPKSEQVYELRSYESASEKLYLNKVEMFNKGEIDIFKNIGSQPVFFGEVLAGSRMPNLIYITAYDNMKSRNNKWDVFGKNPKWKEMSGDPKYQHNMDKADVYYLNPAAYSEI